MISSVSGKNGAPLTAPYAASKHAIEGLSESLRRELMLFGIDVIIVAPGPVKTPIWSKAEEVDISVYKNSPFFPALQKHPHIHAAARRDRIAARRRSPTKISDALTLAKPQGALPDHAGSDPAADRRRCCPSACVDRIIAKRLGLTPQA